MVIERRKYVDSELLGDTGIRFIHIGFRTDITGQYTHAGVMCCRSSSTNSQRRETKCFHRVMGP